MIVYLVTNKANGKRYVGQSEVSLDERWAKHVACSRCPNSYAYRKMPIVRAIAKHGPENFEQKVLVECESYEQMDAEEIRLIAELNTTNPVIGYNVSKGGDAPMRGRKHTSESIEKMRQAKLNMSAETRAAMIAGQARANKDPETRARKSKMAKERNTKMFTPEVRAKISAANSGEGNAFYGKRFGRSANPTPLTEETKRKLSEAAKGKKLSEEHKAAISRGAKGKTSPHGLNRRPVHLYVNGIHIASYFRLEFVAEDMSVGLKTLRRWIQEGKTFEERRYVLDVNTINALRKGMK